MVGEFLRKKGEVSLAREYLQLRLGRIGAQKVGDTAKMSEIFADANNRSLVAAL